MESLEKKQNLDPESANCHSEFEELLETGAANQSSGRFQAALDCYRNALSLGRSDLGEEHIDLAKALMCIGLCYLELNNFAKALVPVREAFALRLNQLGSEDSETIKTIICLIEILRKSKKLSKASGEVEAFLKILPETHPDYSKINALKTSIDNRMISAAIGSSGKSGKSNVKRKKKAKTQKRKKKKK